MITHKVKDVDGKSPAIYKAKDTGSDRLVNGLFGGEIVELVISDEATSEWLLVNYDGLSGWMEAKFLGPLAEDALLIGSVDERDFVRECIRVEVALNTGGTEGLPAVVADYLLAAALLESKLENFDRQFEGSDAIGPFQISSAEWAAFLEDLDDTAPITPLDRYGPLTQIIGAGYLAQLAMDSFSTLEKPNPEAEPPSGPFIPSFLNLFHVKLVGVEAAHKLMQVQKADTDNPKVGEVLAEFYPDSADLDQLLKNRRRYLRDGAVEETVNGFFIKSTNILNEALTRARTLIEKHAPEVTGVAELNADTPWMAFADGELPFWKDKVETDPAGTQRVDQYFDATDYDNNGKPDPWCGAFVAWCLQQAGGKAAESIVSGPARAAHWKNWGEVELLHLTRNKIPRGAIVVLSPAPGTNSSGHVCFYDKAVPTSDKVSCLGGNQSNRVRLTEYAASRIVAIRWLEVDVPAGDEGDNSPVPASPINASQHDLLTLGRTIFGEARSESTAGRHAVANVILNRAASSRYPNTVAKVCLQPWQFSCWNANDPNRAKMLGHDLTSTNSDFQECLQVAREAVAGNLVPDRTKGALHYHTKSILPSWVSKSPDRKVTLREGAHIFYTGIA